MDLAGLATYDPSIKVSLFCIRVDQTVDTSGTKMGQAHAWVSRIR